MHKLTLSLLLVVLIAIIGLGWTLDSLFDYFSGKPSQTDISLYQKIGSTVASIVELNKNPEALIERINMDNNTKLTINHINDFPLPDELRASFVNGEPLALESRGDLTINYYLATQQKVLTITSPLLRKEKNNSPLSLLFTMSFYGGIITLLLLWLSPLINQLIKLKQTAQAFGKGDLTQRVSTGSISYISDIENTFNLMAKQIQTLVSDNKLLGSAVSHDLRTPLARLRFGIDALSEVEDATNREKYQKRISQDVDTMEALVETLLNYARLDQSLVELKKEQVNLVTLVNDCISFADKQSNIIKVNTDTEKIIIKGDKNYLYMLLNNIIGNALQHASALIIVSISESRQKVHLSIEDDGKGVADEELEQVLKPFVRGKDADPSNGYGMGLAISKRIAEWHGGDIQIQHSQKLCGAKILVTLSLHIS